MFDSGFWACWNVKSYRCVHNMILMYKRASDGRNLAKKLGKGWESSKIIGRLLRAGWTLRDVSIGRSNGRHQQKRKKRTQKQKQGRGDNNVILIFQVIIIHNFFPFLYRFRTELWSPKSPCLVNMGFVCVFVFSVEGF